MRRGRELRAVLVSTFVALALAGCGREAASEAAPDTTADTPATIDAGGTTGPTGTTGTTGTAPEALRFVAPLVGGGTLDLARYAGTPVALWFWAPT